MKALIFNSGIGRRMGELTSNCPKSLVHLYNDETILERQLRLIQEAGIKEVVITTGPYPEKIMEICFKKTFENIKFSFVHNEIYASSNYIYSMYKASRLLDDDTIMMHGDLVFDRNLIPNILKEKNENLCLINKFKKLPEKDFKGRIIDNKLREVSVNIFDKDCFAFQPLYKLSKNVVSKWLDRVKIFIERGEIGVYAENALNEILADLNILPYSYTRHFIDEIDNVDDLKRVNTSIEQWDYKEQKIVLSSNYVNKIKKILKNINSTKPLFVIDPFLQKEVTKKFGKELIYFSDFAPNPKYESTVEGIKKFRINECDSIISIGGGSCIDVAKCIKLGINGDLSDGKPIFKQDYVHNCVRHICLPTTCGTGSESTKHAVLYLDGVKQSISFPFLVPDYVILCPKFIVTLPAYQKKSTSLDSLCQCIESIWSRKSNKISRTYALKGLQLIYKGYKGLLNNDQKSIKLMQLGSNFSGKAINISETTAAHAMSYKLTSLFNIPHGHAVAICLNSIFKNCKVKRDEGSLNLYKIFNEIFYFYDIFEQIKISDEEIKILVDSVNPVRLKNFKFKINLKKCYESIRL